MVWELSENCNSNHIQNNDYVKAYKLKMDGKSIVINVAIGLYCIRTFI